jgi:hypothetical protein
MKLLVSLLLSMLLIAFNDSYSMDQRTVSAIVVRRTARLIPIAVDANRTQWVMTYLQDSVGFELNDIENPSNLLSNEEPQHEEPQDDFKKMLLGLFCCNNQSEHES